MKNSAFKDWIVILEKNDRHVQCKYCKKNLNAKHSILMQHSKSKGHIDASKQLLNQKFLEKDKYVIDNTHKIRVSKAEVRQAIFIATHSTFRTSDHMVDVVKESYCDSKIASDIKLGKVFFIIHYYKVSNERAKLMNISSIL